MPGAASLYRRHRPRTFADVVGQEHVVRTLRNAVEQGKVHHAYLFVGSRGTGKTSMAKILAACLNCERGPTVEPDGTCESCVAIANATSLDVIEMDAASNNSVDDIRDLRERVAYAPVSGRHKVYILDEAHMLSPQAWNAFLKTLEEPPPNTIFVLATTEAQKVLPTVVDRCHRFDFARPSVQEIAIVLERVGAQEGIDLPPAARALIARHATGSFRDALGTLEQLVTYGGNRIELDDVLAVLGVADDELLFDTVDAIAARDPRGALVAVARLGDTGRDPALFFEQLEAHARGLLIAQTLGELPAELRLTQEHDARLVEQSRAVQGIDLVRLLDLLAGAIEAVRAGAEARVQLELALVKAAAPEVDPTTRALLARIERLESLVAAGDAPAAPPAAGDRTPPSGGGRAGASAPPAATPRAEPSSEPGASGAAADPPAPRAAASEPASAQPVTATALAEPTSAAPGPGIAAADPADELERLRGLWPGILDAVRAESAMLAALLDPSRPVAFADGKLTLAFPAAAEFRRRQAEVAANRDALIGAIRAVAGVRLRIAYELRDELAAETPATADEPLSEDDLVARLKEAFDAEELPPSDRD